MQVDPREQRELGNRAGCPDHDIATSPELWNDIADSGLSKKRVRAVHEELDCRVEELTKTLMSAVEQLQTEDLQRRVAESTQIAGELRYRLLVENSHELIWSIDNNGCWNYVNATATQEIYGYDPQEMLGRPFTEFMSPEQARIDWPVFEQIKQGRQCYRYETVHLRKDGSHVWLSFTALPHYEEQGGLLCVTGTAIQISDRHAKEARFRGLLEAAPDAIVIVNASGEIVLVNQQTEALFGYDRKELQGQQVEILIPENLRQPHVAFRGQYSRRPTVRSMGLGKELHGLRKSGQHFPVDISLSPMDHGDGMLVIAAIRDISLRKQAEQALHESERRLRLITDSLPAMIAYVDPDLRCQFNNTACEQWCGAPGMSLKGSRIGEFLGEETFQILREKFESALSGHSLSFEAQVPFRQDGPRVIRATLVPHFDDNRRILGVYLFATDVTEMKQAEEIARQSERLASLGSLAAGIAHEINNPMSAVRTATEVALTIKDRPHAAEMLQECLTTIVDSVNRCDQIIQSTLRLARDKHSEFSPHDANELVRDVCKLAKIYFGESGVDIQLNLEANLPEVIVNRLEIEQVFINLIHNAIQASSCGDVVVVRTWQNGPAVRISVEDNGCGMTKEQQELAFNPFYSGRSTGTGLGLALARKLVREHGGSIQLTTQLGVGTTFTVELPQSASQSPSKFMT
jgi:protein-histidine pros-kinase